MPFSWDEIPYTNFHELNLDWFINKFKEIFEEWATLNSTMIAWKNQTETDINTWEDAIEANIDNWEDATISDLNDWKDAFQDLFDETFNNLSDIKTDAEAARDAAQGYAEDAQNAASDITASLDQITENENAIEDLNNIINDISEKYSASYVTSGLDTTTEGATVKYNDENSIKIYGTSTAARRFLFLNGNSGYKTTVGSFVKTLPAGIYLITTELTGYTDRVRIDATYTTFANSFVLIDTNISNNKIINFESDVMIGIVTGVDKNYGTDENPSIVTFKAEKINARDIIARSDISDLNGDIEDLKNIDNKITEYYPINLLDNSEGRITSYESHGVHFTLDTETHKITIYGTATDDSFYNIFGYSDHLRNDIIPGNYLFIKTKGLIKDNVGLNIRKIPSSAIPNYSVDIYENANIYVPKESTAFLLRVSVKDGTIIENPIEIEVEIYSSHSSVLLSNSEEKSGLKMLVFGNSFSYSTLNYLGLIFKEILPEKHIKIGILYRSGETITGHLDGWDNNTKYTTYMTYDSASGLYNYYHNKYTAKQAVYLEEWDYIVFQNTASNAIDINNYNDLEELANKISLFINYPVTYLYNIQQSRPANAPASSYPEKYRDETQYPTGKDRSDGLLLDHLYYVESLEDACIISDIIPCGTAIQNARTTNLANLGTYGDLAYDETGHLQNGLPILIGAYTAAYKLCELMGYKTKLFANQFNPTDADLSAIGYTSGHGNCIGVTDANKLLAEKCALMAIKKPYEISNMSTN